MAEGTRVGFYGDDVTGSLDALLQFRREGWSGALFSLDAVLAGEASGVDAVGIPGVARGLPTADLGDEVLPALDALAALSPRFVQYKACSTVDSSPEVGSLGRVLDLGLQRFANRPVPLLFAQPDFGRYTVFGTHFAAEGGVVHRLDRQPTMSTHPVTPIAEADVVRLLGAQTDAALASVPWTRLAQWLDAPGSPDAVVLDALTDEHLRVIGTQLARLPATAFGLGSGGLSRSLALGLGGPDDGVPPPPAVSVARGPVLAVSGSGSPTTARQVAAAVASGWLAVGYGAGRDPERAVVDGLRSGRHVVAHPDAAASLTSAGVDRAVGALVAAALEGAHVARLVIAGGDTSSRWLRGTGFRRLDLVGRAGVNGVLCRLHAPGAPTDGLEVAFKGGQVGGDDYLVAMAEGSGDGLV